MRFPSINPYIEAVANLSERLRTLKQINPVLDKSGEPIFHASKGVVTFVVEHAGAIESLKCFTSIAGFERINSLLNADIIVGEFFENELFVFNNDEVGDYHTIFMESATKNDEATPKNRIDFFEGRIPTLENGLWGYADEAGAMTIPAQFEFAGEFGEGRAVVGKDGLHGLIDRDGNMIIDTAFDEISWDGSALAYVDNCGKWGCFDRLGRQIVDFKYSWIGEFSHSLSLVKKGDKFGYVNLNGEEVIPLVYDWATSFDENGLANVKICGETVMINSRGEIEA